MFIRLKSEHKLLSDEMILNNKYQFDGCRNLVIVHLYQSTVNLQIIQTNHSVDILQ